MEDINVEYHREVAALTWKIFQNKFSEIPASEIPSMASKVTTTLDRLQAHGIDVSIPKAKFKGILELIGKFKELDTSERIGYECERKKLEGLKSKGKKMCRFYSSLRDELKDVDEQLRVLNCKKQKIESCLARIEKDMSENNGEIEEEEMSRVKEEDLLKAHIEQDFQDLKTFTWNP